MTDHPVPLRNTNPRRIFFRCARLALAGALIYPIARFLTGTFTSATSERAYVNAEMTEVRTPIEGHLKLEPVRVGVSIPAGTTLFRVENARFGNKESMAQLNWIEELATRLEAESTAAAVVVQKQEHVHGVHAQLYAEGLISRLAFLEEETKLAMLRATLSNKQAQAQQARVRHAEMRRQVELQKGALATMPFDGVAWTVSAKDGMEVSAHETVLQVIDPARTRVDAFFHERHSHKIAVGMPVSVRTPDGQQKWEGWVESVRGGVGTIPYDHFAAPVPGEFIRRRVAARIRMEARTPFGPGEFFGVGRNVVVSLGRHE